MKMNDMPKILRQIREDLNTKGECIIQKIADLEHSAIFLKLILNHKDPQVVQSFDVPVFIVDMQYFQIEDWDYLTRIVSSYQNIYTFILKFIPLLLHPIYYR